MTKKVNTKRKLTLDDLVEEHAKEIPNYKQLVSEDQERIVIAQQIYDLRHEAGLTQAELAKKIGTSTSVISRLEDSDYERHSMSLLRRIAAAFGKRVQVRFVDDTDYGGDVFRKKQV